MGANKIILRIVSISFSILVTLLIIVGLVHLGQYGYEFGYRVFTEPAMEEEPGEDVVILLTDDMSEMDIGQMLEENKLIRDKYLFYAQLKLSAYSGKLLSGTYVLNTSMTVRDMMAIMAAKAPEDEETEEEVPAASETETEGTEESEETETEGTEETEDTKNTGDETAGVSASPEGMALPEALL